MTLSKLSWIKLFQKPSDYLQKTDSNIMEKNLKESTQSYCCLRESDNWPPTTSSTRVTSDKDTMEQTLLVLLEETFWRTQDGTPHTLHIKLRSLKEDSSLFSTSRPPLWNSQKCQLPMLLFWTKLQQLLKPFKCLTMSTMEKDQDISQVKQFSLKLLVSCKPSVMLLESI